MNIKDYEILKRIHICPYKTQRELADECGVSLGSVNKSILKLKQYDFVDDENHITAKGKSKIKEHSPKNAIILAAGYGMRMAPINTEVPKGLLEIKGEVLIERIIRQLHEAGVKEIYVVVGFMKEQYEYLIDRYDVKLIVNTDYSSKNNLHSLNLVSEKICNTYIIPCDIWCENNPFCMNELYPWYMITNAEGNNSNVKVNRKRELVKTKINETGNKMIGIAYLTGECSEYVKSRIKILDKDLLFNNSFWEETLFEDNKMLAWAKIEDTSKVFEIDTFEQLREIDKNSNSLNTESLDIISQTFNMDKDKIKNIAVLKKGMTNRSFTFQINEKKYIMRIPGEGTDKLINRTNEAQVYNAIYSKNICEDIIYINEKNGYKITEFIENSRVCNPLDNDDLCICMDKLKYFHSLDLIVDHKFDLFNQIEFYESLWKDKTSVYRDYITTKNNVLSLKNYVKKYAEKEVLTHIDAVPDNFLITDKVYLIDWEYAGMQDPHVDIAMFCIYAMYSKEQIDNLIDIYFDNECHINIRIKIYCYIAICGLLWSNWCEYKQQLGVEFGEYSIRQYRYAKEYYRIVKEELGKIGELM